LTRNTYFHVIEFFIVTLIAIILSLSKVVEVLFLKKLHF